MKYIEKLAPIIAQLISDVDDRDLCQYFKVINRDNEYDCNECRLMGTCWNKEMLLKLLMKEVEDEQDY